MRGIRMGATLLSALMVLLGAFPASATTFTRLARYPEPLWDVISPADTRSALTAHEADVTTVTFFGGTGALPQVVHDEASGALQ